MTFYKKSDSNINQQVVEVINSIPCEKCKRELNLLKSKDGIIVCDKCGFENNISEK